MNKELILKDFYEIIPVRDLNKMETGQFIIHSGNEVYRKKGHGIMVGDIEDIQMLRDILDKWLAMKSGGIGEIDKENL